MFKYFCKRLGWAILALIILLLLVYFLMQAIPTYPLERQNSDTDITYENKLRAAGLLENIFVQFGEFIKKLFTEGKFGVIYNNSDVTVVNKMLDPIKYTMSIAGPAFILASIFGVLLGVVAAVHRGTWVDILINILSVFFISVPSFILAIYLIKIAGALGMPTQFLIFGGAPTNEVILSMIMPILAMTLASIPSILYYTRNEMVEIFKQDYIKVALSKGYTFRQVIWKYAIRNALIPIIAVLLPSFITILSGSIIIEKFFNVPGSATILTDSITKKELYVVMFATTFYGAIYFLMQIVVDISYTFIDPRIVLAEKKANSITKRVKAWFVRRNKLNLLLNEKQFVNYFSKTIEVSEEEEYVPQYRFNSALGQASEETFIDYNDVTIMNDDIEIPTVTQEKFKCVDIYNLSSDQIAGKPTKYFTDVMKRFFKSKPATIFTILLGLIVIINIIISLVNLNTVNNSICASLPASVIAYLPPRISWLGINGVADTIVDSNTFVALLPYNEKYHLWESVQNEGSQWKLIGYNPYNIPELSNVTAIFGTDGLGRDWNALLGIATVKSLIFALLVTVPSMLIGIVYGSVAGSNAGKITDNIMMRIIEILYSVPTILWVMILGMIFGGKQLSLLPIGISLVLVNWMGPAITTRTYILKYKDAEFVQAAKTLGASQARIIFSHMLPNVSGRLFVSFVNMIPRIIFFEASLVFLGLKSATEISLGTMIETARTVQYPFLLNPPVLVLVLISLSSQIIANNLNDSLDPKVSGA